MSEPSRAMEIALENTPEITDERLREKAQEFAGAPADATFDGSAIRTFGVVVWRLLDRLDGYKKALETVRTARVAEAPHNESETSKKAAKSIAPIVNELRYTILNVLDLHLEKGLTADEIEVLTAISGNTVRPRLVEMSTLGWVRKTDLERRTRAGRDAAVWAITDLGRDKLRAAKRS